MKLATCGSCASNNLTPVLDLGAAPLAADFLATAEASRAAQRWPLRLVRCPACTLVQLDEVVPDDLLWGGDYGFYTGAHPEVVEEQGDYACSLMLAHPELCARGVVEIACNDGTMARNFAAAGHRTIGIDPAAGPGAVAAAAGIDMIPHVFTSDLALDLVDERGRPGLVIANHVLGHVADLHDFLAGVRILIGATGAAVVEFQYLADLVLGNQFDHVYHEHRRFLTLSSLRAALAPHDLHVVDVRQTPRQGGSLRCTIRDMRHRVSGAVHRVEAFEAWLEHADALTGLQGRADRIRGRLLAELDRAAASELRVAGYGASAKAATLAAWCGLDVDLVQYMTDTTPAKQGRYLPGTGIPIISPSADSRAPDMYLLTVWNYLPGVLRREAAFTAAGGRWLVPIPQPVII